MLKTALSNTHLSHLLFGTSSVFHSPGLSIYRIAKPRIPQHKVKIVHHLSGLDEAKMDTIEDYLARTNSLELSGLITYVLNDAFSKADNLLSSAGRFGILFTHNLLNHPMKPHLHRQAYSDNPGMCLSFHYSIGKGQPGKFHFYDEVDLNEVIQLNLCQNAEMEKWIKGKKSSVINFIHNQNIIAFNSAIYPHYAEARDNLEAYVIFDQVEFKKAKSFERKPHLLPVFL
jgi:hypothetical protein